MALPQVLEGYGRAFVTAFHVDVALSSLDILDVPRWSGGESIRLRTLYSQT